jgi:hypothetical protein
MTVDAAISLLRRMANQGHERAKKMIEALDAPDDDSDKKREEARLAMSARFGRRVQAKPYTDGRARVFPVPIVGRS